MKKLAFTLAEVLICMVIIGIIAAILINNIKFSDYQEKDFIATARKIMLEFQDASLQIRLKETDQCPMGSFIINAAGTNEFLLFATDKTTVATSQNVVDLFGKYIKYDGETLNFCSHSTGTCSGTTIKGAKLPGKSYIGVEILSSISACPSYKTPGDSTTITPPSTQMCWGKFYIDVNGKDGPNTHGKDVFYFGLDANGLVY